MWRRYRRKSLAPRRPALFEEQYALALLTAIVLIGSIVAVVLVLAHS
jgi:hypothetical protein